MYSLLLSLVLTISHVRGDAFEDLWNQYMQQSEAKFESTVSRRERNLDHWDVPTAAAYLGLHPKTLKPLPRHSSQYDLSSTDGTVPLEDEYIGHDAAILFYAQWCHNCHAVAPSWDAIATHLNAGSRSSNLIMALFDCEKNTRHMEVCLAAGVRVYPTIMFVGSGEFHDTDFFSTMILGKDRSAGPFGATTLDRTVKFQGNWQYGEQILDWINVMRGLSSWHSMNQSAPWRSVRNGIFGILGRRDDSKRKKSGKESASLPVGVPPGVSTQVHGESTSDLQQSVSDLDAKLNATRKENQLYRKAVTHSSHLLDGLLFPLNNRNTTGDGESRDMFQILSNTHGWFQNSTFVPGTRRDEHPLILRSCAMELSVDYCSRVTTRVTNSYIVELSVIPDEEPFPTLTEIESHLVDTVKQQEPYCALVEGCILTNYESIECRPTICPFVNEAACNYLQTCLMADIQNEYALALGLIVEGEKVLEKDWGSLEMSKNNTEKEFSSEKVGIGSWGIPIKK